MQEDVIKEEFLDHRNRMVGSMEFQIRVMKQQLSTLESLKTKASKATSERDLMRIESNLRFYNL